MLILFVCTGNTCRSPMAAALFSHFNPDMQTDSAGLAVVENAACENAVLAMRELGIELSGHVPRPATAALLQAADRICCMSGAQRDTLIAAGVAKERIMVLDVADPYGGSIAAYRQCRDELAEKIRRLQEQGGFDS